MEKIITKDGSIAEVEGAEYLHSLRHTASHIMAQAIKHLYGGADGKSVQLAIGPAIDTGFYYDIDMERKLTDEDLADIEREMKNIVKQNLKLERCPQKIFRRRRNLQSRTHYRFTRRC